MSHKFVFEQGGWIFEHFDLTLTRLSLSSSCWHIMHKAALRQDGGEVQL